MTETLPDLDDYEFFEPLGRGALGVVYLARDCRTNGQVALKWCSADKCDLNDAALYAVFDPSLFVPTVTAGVSDDFVYVVSEYQDAGSLAARLNDHGPWPPQDAAKLVRWLCRSVDQLHSAGIVHGRFKPTDVLFTDQHQPRLSDQMLVARQPDDTDPFRPPEPDPTVSGDIYRLGGILYAALTAQAPLKAGGSIQEEPVAPRKLASGVPHDLQDICLKCLARSPSARYATVAQLAEDLDRFLAHRPLSGVEDADALSPWLWLARSPLAVALPFGLIAFTTFPLTVATGLMATLIGAFVTPTRSWKGLLFGALYGGVLLLIWLASGRLVSVPPPWTLPRETGWLLPWLQRFIDVVRSPSAYTCGYLVFGGLAGWTWQALAALDQRQRTGTRRLYLAVLVAFPIIVLFDDVVIGVDHKPLLFGVVALFIAVMLLPFGMLLGQMGWWTTARRTTLGNARLAAVLGVVLAALTAKAIPAASRTGTWSEYRPRPVMMTELLPPIVTTFNASPERPAPVSDILSETLTHLAPLGILAVGGTIFLAAAATYPRSMTVISAVIGVCAVVLSIIRTFLRDPGLWGLLPGDMFTGFLFLSLGTVVVLAMIAQRFGLTRPARPNPQPVVPGFSGRVLIAACAAALLLFVASALLAGLSQM